ncbi:MAG TPA: 50S ribosomal protein L37ae [Acidobacteriota bacterium]|nr:50S ribosomal protein L37ae [Acidobacteriota bacterium]
MAEKVIVPKTSVRFGTRYGARNRNKVALVESQYIHAQKCKYCNKVAVKRTAVGIYECSKCGSKFTGRAYTAESTAQQDTVDEE